MPSTDRPRTAPSRKAMEEAAKKSAEYLKQQEEPPESHPNPTTPSSAEVEKAVAKSAKRLEKQDAEPKDVHPRATTPSAASVEAAVEQSAKYLEDQATDSSAPAAAGPVTTGRDMSMDATPVSAGRGTTLLDASPVSAGRDRSMDARPVFSSPPPEQPKEES